MEKTEISKSTKSFGLSLAVTSVLSALLVVAKEKSPAVMSALAKLTGQHWVSHSVMAVGLFLALGVAFSLGRGIGVTAGRVTGLLVGGVVLGGLIIAGFYLAGD